MSFSEFDEACMRRAIEIASSGFPAPNPHVGCVIATAKGEIVGEGHHEFAGGPHAEVNALRIAGDRAAGGTAYVTLEPCNAHGRTPPCVDALLAAKVARVVVAVRDPNPKMAGGLDRLRAAGVSVQTGLLTEQAERGNESWLTAVRSERCYLVGKAAMTLDGKVALPDGTSKWITGPSARSQGQRLRAECGAVLVGVGTAISDDPRLNVRDFSVVNQPIKMILDPNGKLSAAIRGDSRPAFAKEGKWIHWTAKEETGFESINEQGDILPSLPLNADGEVDWDAFKAILFQKGITACLIEGGSVTLSSAIRQNGIDRLELFVAPKLFGCGKTWFEIGKHLSPPTMDQVMTHEVRTVSTVGEDIWIGIKLQTQRNSG